MKKVAKVLTALATAALLFSLVACGGATQDTPSLSGNGSQDATASSDEGEGRLLVYDDHGVKVYASSVKFSSASKEQYAHVSVYYRVVNNTDKGVTVDFNNLSVNGYTSDIEGALVAAKNSFETDGVFSTLEIRAENYSLETTQRKDGEYEVSRDIELIVSGEFEINFGSKGKPDKGTFTLTIPANFPEDTFRTDEVWTSTK
jgi:hypothetical protein